MARIKLRTIADNPLEAVVPRAPSRAAEAVAKTGTPKQEEERMTSHLPVRSWNARRTPSTGLTASLWQTTWCPCPHGRRGPPEGEEGGSHSLPESADLKCGRVMN